MIFLSPGVFVSEKDISDIAPRVATSSAAIVGYSAKGSVDDVILVTSDRQFIEEYGEPDPSSGHFFHYSALAYLSKGNILYCLRVENGALYGGADIVAITSGESNAAFAVGKSSSSGGGASGSEDDVAFQILGANPGIWNNQIGIKIDNVKQADDIVPTDQLTFEIAVYYRDDDGNYIEVEKWKVSRKKKVDGFGKQLYLEDKINGVSKYIIVVDNTTETDGVRNVPDTVLPQAQSTRLDFDGGSDGSEISTGDLVSGWDEFSNPDNIDIRLLICGGETAQAVESKMKAVAEARSDCLALLDIAYGSTNTASDMVIWRQGADTHNLNSNYCALSSLWPRIHDPYNDLLIRVPPSGYWAAQMAYNDYVGNPWDAPAGFTRGRLDVLDVTFPSTGKALSAGERDVLYQAQINPFQMFRGEGNVIWGQKTEQVKSSALSRVNVRRLLIVIEKSMAIALRQFVFEGNSELTRFRIEALLDAYLEGLSAQGAFQLEGADRGYHVVCDESNNTPQIIDSHELHVDVFIKPVRAAEFIKLQTIVTPTGASFEELISRGLLF